MLVASIAMLTDLRSRLIPNWLTIPSFFILLALNWQQPVLALVSGVVCALPFAFVYWRGGMGGGDLKLAWVIGVGLGDFDPATRWLLVTSLAGVVHALVVAVRAHRLGEILRKTFTRSSRNSSENSSENSVEPLSIPYAPAMWVGVVVTLLITLQTKIS